MFALSSLSAALVAAFPSAVVSGLFGPDVLRVDVPVGAGRVTVVDVRYASSSPHVGALVCVESYDGRATEDSPSGQMTGRDWVDRTGGVEAVVAACRRLGA